MCFRFVNNIVNNNHPKNYIGDPDVIDHANWLHSDLHIRKMLNENNQTPIRNTGADTGAPRPAIPPVTNPLLGPAGMPYNFQPSVERVSIKLPPFWPEKPTLWFLQVESQFTLNHIVADQTKFNYVCAHLENRYALEVEDILENPPPTDKYDKLKTELIRRLSTSLDQKVRRLLEHEEIGDRTPSQFLRHLQNLAGNSVTDNFLRTLWLGRLPANMPAILATQEDQPLEKVANLADKIHETLSPTRVVSVHSVQPARVSKVASDNISVVPDELSLQSLQQQITELTKLVKNMQSRSRSRSRSRPSNTTNGLCYYHSRFGKDAKKCRTPCTYTPPSSEN